MVGGFSFYERAEIKDLLGYLRLIRNPHDSMALQRVINTPARGIGKTTLETIERLALETNSSTWDASAAAIKNRLIPTRALMALESFRQLILDAQAMMDPDFAGKLAADVAESRADDADTGFGFGAAAAADAPIAVDDESQLQLLDASHFPSANPEPHATVRDSQNHGPRFTEPRITSPSALPATPPPSPSSFASSSTAPATSKPSKPKAHPRPSAALRTSRNSPTPRTTPRSAEKPSPNSSTTPLSPLTLTNSIPTPASRS